MGASCLVMWSEFTVLTSCGKFFCFLVFCFWGSSSSSLGASSPLCSALSRPDCLKTQQSLWVNGPGWAMMRVFDWVACRINCGAVCRFVVAERSSIRPCGLFVFRVWGLYGLLVEFGQ